MLKPQGKSVISPTRQCGLDHVASFNISVPRDTTNKHSVSVFCTMTVSYIVINRPVCACVTDNPYPFFLRLRYEQPTHTCPPARTFQPASSASVDSFLSNWTVNYSGSSVPFNFFLVLVSATFYFRFLQLFIFFGFSNFFGFFNILFLHRPNHFI